VGVCMEIGRQGHTKVTLFVPDINSPRTPLLSLPFCDLLCFGEIRSRFLLRKSYTKFYLEILPNYLRMFILFFYDLLGDHDSSEIIPLHLLIF